MPENNPVIATDDAPIPPTGDTSDGGPHDRTNDEIKHWQAAAKDALKRRDAAVREARELRDRALSPDDYQLFQQLRKDHESAEEARKRKEGEFEAWRVQLKKETDERMTAAEQARQQAEQRLNDVLVDHAFASASDLFGSHEALTILDPDVARAFYAKFVSVNTESGTPRVVVTDPDGHTLLDGDGHPLAFGEAMRKLIRLLPNANRVLRASNKPGSGAANGANYSSGQDFQSLLEAVRSGNADAIKIAKERHRKMGGIQMGS